MRTLYSGTGAKEVGLVGEPISETVWGPVRRAACHLLQARGADDAAEKLRSIRFELQEGTNSFGDEFFILRRVLPIDDYVAEERKFGDGDPAWQEIASTISEIGYFIRFIVLDMVDPTNAPLAVSQPILGTTSETVEAALADAQHLLRASGPRNGVDRLHTAFHGYLKAVCLAARIPVERDPSLNDLFTSIRRDHPAFSSSPARDGEIGHIYRSLASIVSNLDPIRNRRSLAHANDDLLDEPEAMLVVNSIRTLLHYIDARTRQQRDT